LILASGASPYCVDWSPAARVPVHIKCGLPYSMGLFLYKKLAFGRVRALSTATQVPSHMLVKLSFTFTLVSLVASRTFEVNNACSFTIWPAVFTDLNVGSAKPDVETGWKAPAGSVKKFSVPGK
jgi:hypothetical protein